MKTINDEIKEIKNLKIQTLHTEKGETKCYGVVYTDRQIKLIQADYLYQIENVIGLVRQVLTAEDDIQGSYFIDCGVSEYLKQASETYKILSKLTATE